MSVFSADRLKTRAVELGFNLVGITPAAPSPTLRAYLRWIERGMHGTMNYMARPDREARRRDLNVILPGVRSLVVVGLDYRSFAIPEHILNDPARGRIAAYAWNLDYHDIMTPRLEQLAEWIQAESGQTIDAGHLSVVLRKKGASRGGSLGTRSSKGRTWLPSRRAEPVWRS